jgi:hypothetical protein
MEVIEKTFGEQAEEGDCQVRFRVKDPVEQLKVEMPSKRMKVRLTPDLIRELEDIEQVSYSLS